MISWIVWMIAAFLVVFGIGFLFGTWFGMDRVVRKMEADSYEFRG